MPSRDLPAAQNILGRCRILAACSDHPDNITRTFLSEAMRRCYAHVTGWMEELGMQVHIDPAGNLRGFYEGTNASAGRILLASHLDTVPNAGAYDGVLGVVLALELVRALNGERLPFGVEVIGFSEEEGVRFGFPFIGSRALIGDLDGASLRRQDRSGLTVEEAIRDFGLDPTRLNDAVLSPSALAYFEFHIEQGPVLESFDGSLGVVEAVAGQTRASISFHGKTNHAGTTPMDLRQDALCGAAEWILAGEKYARSIPGLVSTTGKIEAFPGATNAISGEVRLSLDARHAEDAVRSSAVAMLLRMGQEVAAARGLNVESQTLLDQPAVPMHRELSHRAERAIAKTGAVPYRMTSGAGHDAMIIARRLPCAMIFLRSPGGISHHPDESVREEDVALALQAGMHLLRDLSECPLRT